MISWISCFCAVLSILFPFGLIIFSVIYNSPTVASLAVFFGILLSFLPVVLYFFSDKNSLSKIGLGLGAIILSFWLFFIVFIFPVREASKEHPDLSSQVIELQSSPALPNPENMQDVGRIEEADR